MDASRRREQRWGTVHGNEYGLASYLGFGATFAAGAVVFEGASAATFGAACTRKARTSALAVFIVLLH